MCCLRAFNQSLREQAPICADRPYNPRENWSIVSLQFIALLYKKSYCRSCIEYLLSGIVHSSGIDTGQKPDYPPANPHAIHL